MCQYETASKNKFGHSGLDQWQMLRASNEEEGVSLFQRLILYGNLTPHRTYDSPAITADGLRSLTSNG